MITKLHMLPLFGFTSGATLMLALFGIKLDGFTIMNGVYILLSLSQGVLAIQAIRTIQKVIEKN